MNDREKFDALCKLLPAEVMWGDEITPHMLEEILQAAHAESAARIAELEQKLAEAEGMGECTLMLRDDLIQAGIIKDTVPPMFLTEAILGHIQAITNTGDKTT